MLLGRPAGPSCSQVVVFHFHMLHGSNGGIDWQGEEAHRQATHTEQPHGPASAMQLLQYGANDGSASRDTVLVHSQPSTGRGAGTPHLSTPPFCSSR